MLVVTDLSFERYFEPVFKPVSFALEAGQLLLVTGPNGSGKTTLLRVLAGLLTPTEGAVDCQSSPLYAGHSAAIKDDLSVVENIRFMLEFLNRRDTELWSTSQLIKAVGLTDVALQHGRTLSAGQRKRCAMARLIFCNESLWLLDEPYSNLDHDGARLLDSILEQHLQRGGACVMATHGSLKPQGFEYSEYELQSGRQQINAA